MNFLIIFCWIWINSAKIRELKEVKYKIYKMFLQALKICFMVNEYKLFQNSLSLRNITMP